MQFAFKPAVAAPAAPAQKFGGLGAFGANQFSTAGAAFAHTAPLEKVPVDETDKKLYYLDRACGVGLAMQNDELRKQLPVVPETAEAPLRRLRELLRPFRKSEERELDRISTYAFRKILYEQRDRSGELRTFDPMLMTAEEWKEEYGENPKEAKRFETTTNPPIPLAPIPVDGFAMLGERLQVQDKNLGGATGDDGKETGHGGFTKIVAQAIAQLQLLEQQAKASGDKMDQLREKSRMQLQRLLRVARNTELVAFHASTRGRDENPEEAALRHNLQALLHDLQREQQLGPRVDDLYQHVQDRERLLAIASHPTPHAPEVLPGGPVQGMGFRHAGVDDNVKAQLARAINILGEEITRLQQSVAVSKRHVGVASNELGRHLPRLGVAPGQAQYAGNGQGRRAVAGYDGGLMYDDAPT